VSLPTLSLTVTLTVTINSYRYSKYFYVRNVREGRCPDPVDCLDQLGYLSEMLCPDGRTCLHFITVTSIHTSSESGQMPAGIRVISVFVLCRQLQQTETVRKCIL